MTGCKKGATGSVEGDFMDQNAFLLDRQCSRGVDTSSVMSTLEVVIKGRFLDFELLCHRFIGLRGVEKLVADGKLDWISHYRDSYRTMVLAREQQRVPKGRGIPKPRDYEYFSVSLHSTLGKKKMSSLKTGG